MIRIHCVKPIGFGSVMYGRPTQADAPIALVVLYNQAEEVIVEVPGLNVPPGNHPALDEFGNKYCSHLHSEGDIWTLPDQYTVEAYGAGGRKSLLCNGVPESSGWTDLTFTTNGGDISVTNGNSSFEGGPFYICSGSESVSGSWHSNTCGPHSGTFSGPVGNITSECIDYKGMDWPYSLDVVHGLIPWITMAEEGYTPSGQPVRMRFDSALAQITLLLEGLVTDSQMLISTKLAWKYYMPNVVADALTGLRLLHINSIAYLRDSVELRRSLSVFRQLKKHPLSKKTWANLWLTYRYGLRLYALDTISIAQAIKKEISHADDRFQSARAVYNGTVPALFGNPIEVTCRAKVYADKYSVGEMGLYEAIRSLDFVPSLANSWDLIPYSFVIDWFLPIGNILSRFDAISDVDTLHTRSCVASVKHVKQDHISGLFRCSGDVKHTCYQRKVISPNDLSSMLASLSVDFCDGVNLIHFFDGLGLRFQRH